MSIAARLQELKVVKNNIKSALQNKGVNMTNVPFTEYANKIGEISTEVALTGNAQDHQVLSGWTYYNTDSRTKRTGTMPNRAAWTSTINPGESATIPYGYHDGYGRVTCNAASDHYSGYKEVKNTNITITECLNNGWIPLSCKVSNIRTYWSSNGSFQAPSLYITTNGQDKRVLYCQHQKNGGNGEVQFWNNYGGSWDTIDLDIEAYLNYDINALKGITRIYVSGAGSNAPLSVGNVTRYLTKV